MERKNKTLLNISRTPLIDVGIAKNLWTKFVNVAYYMINKCLIRSVLKNTLYELLTKKKTQAELSQSL